MKEIGLITLFYVCSWSCSPPAAIDLANETKEILKLDSLAREFHFTKNAQGMVDGFSKDFVSINRGVINQPEPEASFQRINAYFNRVDFIKWDNNREPIIRFSDDASMAYVTYDKIVILKEKDESGMEKLDTTIFAWLSVFKKENGKWILDEVCSTNQ